MKPGRTGFSRVWHATRYSWMGLTAAWRSEAAFRQECVLTILLIPAAFWLGRNPLEWALLIGACLIVLAVELLNSAIEAITDRVSAERHELSGRAKDMGSAAVLLSLVLVAVVWSGIAADRWLF